jgi:hypothetical protein
MLVILSFFFYFLKVSEAGLYPYPKKDPALTWKVNYLKAMQTDNSALSCQLFKKLSFEKNFPIKSMAFIRSLQKCPYSKAKLINIWKAREPSLPKWAYESYFKQSLKLAASKGIKTYQAYFLYRLSAYQKGKHEKEAMLLKSLKLNPKPLYKKALQKVGPRYIEKVTPFNIYKIARDYEHVRNFPASRKLYREITKDDKYSLKLKIKAYNRLRLSFKKEHKKETYINLTKEMGLFLKRLMEQFPKDQKIQQYYAKNQTNLARAVWTEHRREEGKKILTDLLSIYRKKGNILADIYWLLGSMMIEEKNLNRALFYFEKGSALNISDNQLKDQINWARGWNNYLLKNYHRSKKIFHDYQAKTTDLHLKDKLRFWISMSEKKLNRQASYRRTLKKLIK